MSSLFLHSLVPWIFFSSQKGSPDWPLLFISTILLEIFLIICCRFSRSPPLLLGPYSICFPRGLVNKIPLLGRGWDYFFVSEIWPSLHPFIWNSIILASPNFFSRVCLATLFTNMETEDGRALTYTSICNSRVGLALDWNLFKNGGKTLAEIFNLFFWTHSGGKKFSH